MLLLLARRLASMLLIMAAVSFILFVVFESNKLGVAGKVLGPYSSVEQRELWLDCSRAWIIAECVGNARLGEHMQTSRHGVTHRNLEDRVDRVLHRRSLRQNRGWHG